MTRSDSQMEKSGTKNLLPEEAIFDGTSARTRPLSFDDIILRRKKKGDAAKQISSAYDVTDFRSEDVNAVKTIDFPQCHDQTNYDSEPLDEINNSNYSQKERSERKGDTRSYRKHEKKHEKIAQVNVKGSPDLYAKSKNLGARKASSNIMSKGKNERENHGNRKKDGLLSIDSVSGPDKRKTRDSYKTDRFSGRGRVKSEIVKNEQHNEDSEVNKKRKCDGWISNDFDIVYKERNVKDELQTEKLASRGREKPEKQKKNKHHHVEDKTRPRMTIKKNDLAEPARTYLEESRPKCKRSRSREHEKDRGRRSCSQSPKAYKLIPKDRKRELSELAQSSHPTKDRSGREHPDVDKRMSSNGSGSLYRRNTNSSSGLGGYSPRKRKTDAAAKTPSPSRRSPDRRMAGWDLQPAENETIMAGSTVTNLDTASQNLLLNAKELSGVNPVTTAVVKPIGISNHNLSSQMHAVESIQLTQATRPMRRLYVENLPATASEEDFKKCINKLLLSSGVNHIHGTEPCISTIIHKEKSQALLEFLTPEDASAALCLDGMLFSGSCLKLRRPKDYANVSTGLSEKAGGTVDSMSDIVADSPNKIFIGGISKLYTTKMLLEIVRAFGAVKAFHFEFIVDINEPCAFFEYVDHSVTAKACAGLNGMRLGGHVLTAVPATPEPFLENVGKLPIYEIPEHAKPLLEKPTAVLKLKNMLDPDWHPFLSESEIADILHDIKLECSRFGAVKSVNVAKITNTFATVEAYGAKNRSTSTGARNLEFANGNYTAEKLGESSYWAGQVDRSEIPEVSVSQTLEDKNGCDKPKGINKSELVGDSLPDEMIEGNTTKDETCIPPMNGDDASVGDPLSKESPGGLTGEFNKQLCASDIIKNYDGAGYTSMRDIEMEDKLETIVVSSYEELLKSEENDNSKLVNCNKELKLAENCASFDELNCDERKQEGLDGDEKGHILVDIERVFEAGSVFVEYRRVLAACMAAHCLHGRTFDGRVVTVEYVGHDLYKTRFRGQQRVERMLIDE